MANQSAQTVLHEGIWQAQLQPDGICLALGSVFELFPKKRCIQRFSRKGPPFADLRGLIKRKRTVLGRL